MSTSVFSNTQVSGSLTGECGDRPALYVQGSPDWEVRGALGNRWLFVLRELLQLLPSWDNVRADVRRFLEAAQQASQASVSMIAGESTTFRHAVPFSF